MGAHSLPRHALIVLTLICGLFLLCSSRNPGFGVPKTFLLGLLPSATPRFINLPVMVQELLRGALWGPARAPSACCAGGTSYLSPLLRPHLSLRFTNCPPGRLVPLSAPPAPILGTSHNSHLKRFLSSVPANKPLRRPCLILEVLADATFPSGDLCI